MVVRVGGFIVSFLIGLLAIGSNIGRSNKWVSSHLLFTYQDGLVRRSLVGSVIETVAPSLEISTALATGIGTAALVVFIGSASMLVATGLASGHEKLPAILAGALLLVSSHTKTFAIDVGRFDVILVTASILCAFAIRHSVRLGSICAILLGGAAVLVHENAVIVAFPLILAMLAVRRSLDVPSPSQEPLDRAFFTLTVAGMGLLAGLAVSLPTVAPETVQTAMRRGAQRASFTPSADAFSVHSNGLSENLSIMLAFWQTDAVPAALVLILALLPAAWVAWRVIWSTRLPLLGARLGRGRGHLPAQSLLFAAALAPLLLFAVGVDYGRWTSIAVANMAIAALWATTLPPSLQPVVGAPYPDESQGATGTTKRYLRASVIVALVVAMALPIPARGRPIGFGFESDPALPFRLTLRGVRELLGLG